MTDFEGIQSNPDPVKPYVDPMQWFYDLTQDEQDKYRESAVAAVRKVCEVVGLDSVASNTNWSNPDNLYGINPVVWKEYKRIMREKEFVAGPV